MHTINEKMTHYGPEALTTKEVMSMFLEPTLIETLYQTYDDVATVLRKDWKQIAYDCELSDRQAQKVGLLGPLSQRLCEAQLGDDIRLTSPMDAVAYLAPLLRHVPHEQFYVVFLNNAKKVRGRHKISDGGSSATIVDPSEVLRQAIIHEAGSILLAHNHPSGNPKASKADIKLTRRIAEPARQLGIPVDDHMIIAGDSYTSLRERGHLPS